MEPLKNLYTPAFLKKVSEQFAATEPSFDKKRFLKDVLNKDWEQMELKQRMKHIARVLQTLLHHNYKKDIETLIAVIHSIQKSTQPNAGLEHMFFSEYVELFGLEEYDVSMKAIEEITQFISCEYTVRPFIIKYPAKTMAQMQKWSKHPHHYVRRLSSEGCRPRLPWSMALPVLKKDPALILPILERLKNDPSEFVRRSVANNLNDIAKDNPEIVVSLAVKWKGIGKETDWIIKHGCRTLLKKAHAGTLDIFGLVSAADCEVSNLKLTPMKIQIGETLNFSFRLTIRDKNPLKLRLEYGIYYMKSNGKWSRKLFKITENVYSNTTEYTFKRNLSFKNLTTRKHYSGKHKLAIVVNGVEKQEHIFTVLEER